MNRIHLVLTVPLLAVTCRGSTPVTLGAPAALAIHIDGETNPDSMPPSCRYHGGTPPIRSGPPRWMPSGNPSEDSETKASSGDVLLERSSGQ